MRKIGETDKCVKCGNTYTIDSPTQKYCKICSREDIARRASEKYHKKNEPKKKEKVCPFCGKTYLSKDNRVVYCSEECQKKQRKIKMKENLIRSRTRKKNEL